MTGPLAASSVDSLLSTSSDCENFLGVALSPLESEI